MHAIALKQDGKIVTWGGNDEGALGRDTAWEGGLRDMDAEAGNSDGGGSDSEEEASIHWSLHLYSSPRARFPPEQNLLAWPLVIAVVSQ